MRAGSTILALAAALACCAGQACLAQAAAPAADARAALLDEIAKEASLDPAKAQSLRPQLEAELDMREILAKRAAAEGLDRDPQVKAKLELAKLGTLSQAYLGKLAESMAPSDADLASDYDSTFPSTRMAKVKFAVFASQPKAAQALADLKRGAIDMAKASAMGDDKLVAKAKGDFGWVGLDALPSELAKAISADPAKRPAAPVKTAFGYIVYELDKVEARRAKTFEEAKPELAERRRQMMVRVELAKVRMDLAKPASASTSSPAPKAP